jgi:hypothetical protein
MKITICGSTAFIDNMAEVATELEKLGHQVKFPPIEIPGPDGKTMHTSEYYELKKSAPKDNHWLWQSHHQRIQDHFDKIDWADSILVLNYDKNGVKNYVGPNTLIEMGVSFYLKKPVYLLNPIPDMPYAEEILGIQPIILEGNLEKIH